MNSVTNDHWLQTYLHESARRKLCTRIRCTTCAALDFRRGLLRAYGNVSGYSEVEFFDAFNAVGILRALATVKRPDDFSESIAAAVRCILYDLWLVLPVPTVHSMLAGSWSGDVLKDMEKHNSERRAAQRAREEFEDPVRVQQRRDEKKRLKQKRHQQRLALKVERDRVWREKHDS